MKDSLNGTINERLHGPILIFMSQHVRNLINFVNITTDNGFCIPVSYGVPSRHMGLVGSILDPVTTVAAATTSRGVLSLVSFGNMEFRCRSIVGCRVSCSCLSSVHSGRVSASPLCTVFADNSAKIPGNMIVDRHNTVSLTR